MKIIHILNHTKRSNGHVHAAVDLACEQTRQNHEVCIASEGGDFDELLINHGVSIAFLSHRRKFYFLPFEIFNFYREIQKNRPDIVHAHMMTSAVLSWLPCKISGIPLITTVHNEFERSAILMGLGNKVIAVSKAVGASMRKRGIPKRKLEVVLNGTIGSARLKSLDHQPIELEKPSIVFVGGLHPRKGLMDLLIAFEIVYKKYDFCKLYVIGSGPHSSEYKAYAAQLTCASAINFLGSIGNVLPHLTQADIFVLPSHADPAPLVISEAREAACAVIATSVDGIPELLENGQAGILVPPKQPTAIANALLKLLDSQEALNIWKQNSQIGIEKLRISRVCNETLRVYSSAIAQI